LRTRAVSNPPLAKERKTDPVKTPTILNVPRDVEKVKATPLKLAREKGPLEGGGKEESNPWVEALDPLRKSGLTRKKKSETCQFEGGGKEAFFRRK